LGAEALEDRHLFSAAPVIDLIGPADGGWTGAEPDNFVEPANAALSEAIASTTVVGRRLFYNQSGTASPVRYDGNNPAINADDDLAIATDKSAYLPGSGSATFANVSSYTKGINGIMIDLQGTHGTITTSDFIFHVGNNNTPSSWASAPAPNAISVRPGAGIGGSDRVVLTWPTSAIQKKWLEVIVIANANTGLDQKAGYPVGQGDVFYFGSAVGDTGAGDTATQANVSVTDELGARNNPASLFSNIPVTNVYDFNRDAQVNSNDQLTPRNNATSIGTVTRFINVSSPPLAPEATPATADATVLPLTDTYSAVAVGLLRETINGTEYSALTAPSSRSGSISDKASPAANSLAGLSTNKIRLDAGTVAQALWQLDAESDWLDDSKKKDEELGALARP